MSDAPQPGDVLDYPYLWAWQHAQGETEGRKSRPVSVVVTLAQRGGATVVYLLAITSQPPLKGRKALELPEMEKRRAQLDTDRPLWVVLDEYNSDLAERSFYLTPEDRIGHFSSAFLKQLQTLFRGVVAAGGARSVGRSDD